MNGLQKMTEKVYSLKKERKEERMKERTKEEITVSWGAEGVS